jgi:hypothetical protein
MFDRDIKYLHLRKKFPNKNKKQKSDLQYFCSDQGCQKRQKTTVFKTLKK